MHAFMIAGTGSGSGKTTITAGLMRALSGHLGKGGAQEIVPFKCGPDYIDPMFHRFACGFPSVNLDPVLLEDNGVHRAFERRMQDTKNTEACAVIEGAMGLYDGLRESGRGSAADVSKILGVPVFLIVDGRGMSQSAAALVQGFQHYDPEVRIAGIIINRIKNESHYQLLSGIIEESCGIPCVGWLPENPGLRLESRHLGLIPAEELAELSEILDRAAENIREHFDLDQILALSRCSLDQSPAVDPYQGLENSYSGLTVAVARDKAFNFYYTENLELMRRLGVTLTFFSPMADTVLPEADAFWFGGGYPEVFAEELENNTDMRESIRGKLESGSPCYAECGGQIYLSDRIIPGDGISREGVGFLPGTVRMTERLQRFGYADLNLDFEDRNYRLKIHEFHHSVLEPDKDKSPDYRGEVTRGKRSWPGMQVRKNTLAGYPHIHFYAMPDGPELLTAMLDYVRRVKNGENSL
ncbi:MAG: cobyrinate a,c-diamide synthase [Eubacteriaceae bacterium]|jgi:cobyrinic acid a,c-diamide synthase